MNLKYVRIPVCLIFISILGACQLLPRYQYPMTPVPDVWKNIPEPIAVENQAETPPAEWKAIDEMIETLAEKKEEDQWDASKEAIENWWEIFHECTLNQLIEQGIESSYTLQAALERIYKARAYAWIQRSPLLPYVSFDPSFFRQGSLIQNPISNVGSSSTTTLITPSSSGSFSSAPLPAASPLGISLPQDFRFVQQSYKLPFDMSYEIDLWNKIHNQYFAAVYRAQATTDEYLNILLTLTSDIAIHYFQLKSLDNQINILKKTILARKDAFEINNVRFKAGLSLYMDVLRAEVELERAEADLADTLRLRGLEENTLATLIGVPAPVFSIPFNPLKTPPPIIPNGLPSELLLRRPDIAEAERNLAAAYAEVEVAYTSFFPSLIINASLGLESPFAHSLFSWKARFWEVGWNAAQTVFDAGRNCANYDYYRAIFNEMLANYQETVLKAFQDVEDSLDNIRGYKIQYLALSEAVEAARGVLNLSQMRYTRGLVNYLDVVDAERTLLQVEQNSAIILGNRYASTVRLIKALGGGWGPNEDECQE